jgi:hypothetical protein
LPFRVTMVIVSVIDAALESIAFFFLGFSFSLVVGFCAFVVFHIPFS